MECVSTSIRILKCTLIDRTFHSCIFARVAPSELWDVVACGWHCQTNHVVLPSRLLLLEERDHSGQLPSSARCCRLRCIDAKGKAATIRAGCSPTPRGAGAASAARTRRNGAGSSSCCCLYLQSLSGSRPVPGARARPVGTAPRACRCRRLQSVVESGPILGGADPACAARARQLWTAPSAGRRRFQELGVVGRCVRPTDDGPPGPFRCVGLTAR
jgi:hypothetical protein